MLYQQSQGDRDMTNSGEEIYQRIIVVDPLPKFPYAKQKKVKKKMNWVLVFGEGSVLWAGTMIVFTGILSKFGYTDYGIPLAFVFSYVSAIIIEYND